MAYTILHLSRNNQRTHLIVDDVTTLPVMFATIYGMNELSKKSLGTQENILCSLRFFYVYYYKKHKQTFDYDFYRSGYNIGFAPIFPDTCYHLTHYWPAAVDITVASDNPVHYADAIRYNARTPLQGSLLPLTRLVWA